MDLPDDILFSSILPKLDVKSLLRFLCVSKSWNSLIKSSNFIAAHRLHHPVNDNKNSYLLYMHDYFHQPEQIRCTIIRESTDDDKAPPSYAKHRDLVLPLISQGGYVGIGVCEGLICLTMNNCDNQDQIYIWNPLVGTIKPVPLITNLPRERYTKDGFGFVNDDFKIVRIIFEDWWLVEVHVYSLATDSWTILLTDQIERVNRYFCRKVGIFFEGSIYWLAIKNLTENDPRTRLILKFDMKKEIIEEIEAPGQSIISTDPEQKYENELVVMANETLVYVEYRNSTTNFLKCWVMNSESKWININASNFVLDPCYILDHFDGVTKSGHLICRVIDDIPDDNDQMYGAPYEDYCKVFVLDCCRDIDGGKLREMKFFVTEDFFSLVRVRETMFLI